MSSYRRAPRNAPPPPPLYLTSTPSNPATYCKTCGRIISSSGRGNRAKSNPQIIKYCSDRCRRHKPGQQDRCIENIFVRLLNGDDVDPKNPVSTAGSDLVRSPQADAEGVSNKIVSCDEVQRIYFERFFEPEGMQRNGKPGSPNPMLEATENLNTGSATAGQQSTDASSARQRVGQRRAEEREAIRRAARRGCVFGFNITSPPESDEAGVDASQVTAVRKCEAVQLGKVVEPSFAKGDWGIRWRE